MLFSYLIYFIGLEVLFPFNIQGICLHQKHKTKTTELLPQYEKKRINGKNTIISKYISIYSLIVHIRQELPSWFRPASLIMPPWMFSRVQSVTNIPGRNILLNQRYSKLLLNAYLPICLRATDSKSPSIYEDECSHTHGNTLHDAEGNDAAA